ncbi:MAG: HAD-IA family hydrolase [Candidatus Bathyarchaeia archaeon]
MPQSSEQAWNPASGLEGVKAVLFDLSGVLLDDLWAVWQANAKVLEHYTGVWLGLEQFRRRFTLPYWRFYEELGVSHAQARVEANELFKRFYAQVKGRVRLFPEVADVLRLLEARGLMLCVVSQTPRALLAEHLEREGIRSFFRVFIGLEDTTELKPSPEPVQEALVRAGLPEPSAAVYVGDMEEDIIAGRRAGVHTVAVLRLNSYQPWFKVKRQHPDYVVHSLEELSGLFASR